MKRKFKRASKSMLSVILAILIVMSTMLIGTLSVNAAENGKFTAGETIYFDFRDPVNNPVNEGSKNGCNIYLNKGNDYVASCDPSWDNDTNRYIKSVQDYVSVTLSSDIDFSTYDGEICKVGGYDWPTIYNDKAKLPTGTQNMIVLKNNGNNNYTYEWGTYSGTPTPPGNTNYYIEGRFRVKNTSGTNAALLEWAFDSTSIPFNATENDGIYKIETNCTLSDLSENIYCPNGDYTASQYFYVWEQNSNQYYSASNLNMQNCLGSGNAASMSSCTFDSNDNWMHFSGTNSAVSSDAKITLYLDTNNGMKLYYTTDEVSEPHNVTIKSNIKVTATAEGADPVVLNETGDSETEGSTTVSASTLTLTASAVDYNFAGWKLGEGASIMSGSVTSPTITVKVTADTTITATAITLTPRLSVNSSVAKNTTARVLKGTEFTLNALSKVGDKTQKATKYTVDFYQYTTDIKNAVKIGSKEITNVNYDRINSLVDASGNKREPLDGEYLIGDEYTAVLPVTINEAGTYHFYADIKGYDNAGNLTTGEYADVSLGTSKLKDDVVVTVFEPVDKENAYESGLWVDVQPSVIDSKIALIKWTNKSGNDGDSGNTYTLYVPGGITLNTMPVYSKFANLQINGTPVAQGGTYNFTHGGSYTVTGEGVNCTLNVYQSTSDSMLTSTAVRYEEDRSKVREGDNLPTKSYGVMLDKVEYNGHFMSITASDGAICDNVDIEKIKGRGNSSWEASGTRYGKYAYNVKFTDKIKPLKMNDATKAKSWCLLANNMDPSALRNVSIYQTAKLAGLSNVPEYKVADFYNNGEYLGSYLITEKVDVGGSKLVDGETPEDYYDGSGDGATHTATYTYGGQSYQYQYVNTGNLNINPATGEKYRPEDFSYLIEFDLEVRAKAEHCWFQTPQGQYIAFKAPEDINQNEMLFVINKWIEAENAVYNGTYSEMNNLLDLDSFADVYLVQEFTKNLDSGATSYYVYWNGKTAQTVDASDVKWEATPIWDYDWALGAYYKVKDIMSGEGVTDGNGQPNNTEGWLTKYKKIVQDENRENGVLNKLNFQAKLANNTDFWNTNVKNSWNSDFYDSVKSVYSDNGYLKSAYDANYNSFDMNEKRYGFVNSNPTSDWGTVTLDEGKKTPQGAYEYLLDWTTNRANWMNEKLEETVTVSLGSDKTEINTGETVTLTANITTNSSYPITYKYYVSKDGGEKTLLQSTTESTYTTLAITEPGDYTYYVDATYSTYTKAAAIPVTVKVTGVELPELKGVVLEANKTKVTPGTTVTLTATASPAEVTECIYTFYNSNDEVVRISSTSNTASVTLNTVGTYSYYVKAAYNGVEKTSATVTVTVEEPVPVLTKVTLTTSTTSVAPGNSITLRANSEPSTIKGYKYTFYHSDDPMIGDTDDTAINTPSSTDIKTLVLTPPGAGKHYYYVVASCDGKESVTSEMICVTVEEQRGEHTVRVWFKSASTNVYVPSVSLDGGAYTRMTRIKQGLDNSTYFGSTYSGSLKFYWYFADVTLDSTFTHKLTFKTAGTSVIATSESSKFNSDNYYFAVDNLMNDTKLVDLTDKPDYIRNYHRSATHMVYNNLLDADSSLGFTYVYEDGVGKEYPMGYILKQQNDNSQNEAQTAALNSRLVKIDVPSAASLGAGNAAFTIESATLTQKFVADIIDVSELQRCLLDVNLDEQVDIRDVTLMQKALAQ